MNTSLKVSDFHYELPRELIAQIPVETRDQSRLLIMSPSSDSVFHRRFRDITSCFKAGDVLVLNDVRVIPARLKARRKTGGKVEVFLLEGWKTLPDRVLLSPARRLKIGEELLLQDGWSMTLVERLGDRFAVIFRGSGNFGDFIDEHGDYPVPPYIQRNEDDERLVMDRVRYQTTFADEPGAIAAPTAGLHFTPELLDKIRQLGVEVCALTLWVGWGTFKPIKVAHIRDHVMDGEKYRISTDTAGIIRRARAENRRIIAVGTTVTRALESWAKTDPSLAPVNFTESFLFITPGFKFMIVDALITNFHLPGSTLMMLVSALAGRDRILRTYQIAVNENYRFYSYGDAMFINNE